MTASVPQVAESARKVAEGAPRLSVVVASFRNTRLLEQCLASLHGQCDQLNAEIIVARAGSAESVEHVTVRHPRARVVVCPSGTTIPELRAAGLRQAGGDVIALTEDHCVADEGWLAELVSGYLAGADIVGGSMGNAQQQRSVDWGAYFAEYGFFAQARAATPAIPAVTGANVAYGRESAHQAAELASGGAWENVIHARLLEHGRTVRVVQTAIIAQNQNYRFGPFCRDRYEHGRDYARVRLREEGTARRWVYAGFAFALPFILVGRIARRNAIGHPVAFLRALPFTFAFLSAWSLGELAGYCRGPAPLDARDG